jgi:hypothetical protein
MGDAVASAPQNQGSIRAFGKKISGLVLFMNDEEIFINGEQAVALYKYEGDTCLTR